ncbi:hypothetical protein ACH41E_14080 [Streptomyces sp. NPDC020412]|uniref:hypothetical protein n=1 Tax=Streptomyces sp. NPDC020412 TaxID=3365073 RepID=UPI0037BA717E
MRLRGRVRAWSAAAAGAVVLALLPGPAHAGAAAPDPGQRAGRQQPAAVHYLNLHQCVYYDSGNIRQQQLTTAVPSRDGRFLGGTNVSNTAQTSPVCGPGDGRYLINTPNTRMAALDLTAGRYLNLHQCVYYSANLDDHLTTIVPRGFDFFSTGTNVSNTPETEPWCYAGHSDWLLVDLFSSVKSIDLTAGRYVNLQQCMFYSSRQADHFTTFVPSGDGRFAAGTAVSNTRVTTPACGPGDGNFLPVPLLSGSLPLDLA